MNTQSTLPGYANRWRAMLFIGISLIVISLDNTILNVAIPSISRDLGASASELQWIIDSYVLVFAALLLTMGAVGDRVGRKISLQVGLGLFALGSLAAALSTSTEMLIAARAFLGIGGAIIMPATLSIISATFPPNERSQAIAIWAAVFGLGVGLGPVLGGWLLEHYSWEAAFLVNLPVAAIAIVGGQLYIAESKDESAPRPDIPGVILSIIGLFALVYAIIEAGQKGWTEPVVLEAFAAAVIFLGLFAWWENQAEEPMLPLYFFKNMSFTGANTALALVTFSLFGSVFFLSQYFQSVQGLNPLESGLRVVPMAVVLTISAAMSARLLAILGTKYTVALGIFIGSLGLLFMSQVYKVDTHYSTIVIGQILLALGLGTAMSPATNSVMQSVPVSKAGIGSAMNDTTRQLGGALGIAVLGTVMNNTYIDGVAGLKGTLSTLPPMPGIDDPFALVERSIQGANGLAAGLSQNPQTAPLAAQIHQTASDAFVHGMNNAMIVGAVIMMATAVLTLLILPAEIRHAEDMPEAHAHDKHATSAAD